MNADLIDKATGKTIHVSSNDIRLSSPGVVRLDLDRSQVASLERQGNDLRVHLTNGEVIQVANFYVPANGVASDLVLRDHDQALWLADTPTTGPAHFSLLKDIDQLTDATAAGGGGGALLPVLLGVAGAGGIAAAVGSGGGGSGGKNPSGSNGPAADTTPPTHPTAAFNPDGTSVSGTGEVGATIQIRDSAGTVIGTGTVAANGSYAVTLSHPDTNGESVTVTQADAAGNVSPPATAVAPDLTAPTAPTATVAADGASVTGTGEPGATVTITDAAGQPVASTTVGGDGTYTAPLPSGEADGGSLTVTQTDPAGNTSSPTTVATPDLVAPDAPTATVAADGASVTGTGEPGATVTITDAAGQPVASTTVGGDGTYTAPLPSGEADGGSLTVTQTDPAGNSSSPTTVATPDLVAPDAPTATVAADGASVTGTGEPGATVTITDAAGQPVASTTVGGDGTYTAPLPSGEADGGSLTVTQTDPAGNTSSPTTVATPDLVAPDAPTATVAADGATVTGTGEPGATVTITDAAGQPVASTTVGGDGTYTAPLPSGEADGGSLTVTQTDPAGNTSSPTTVATPDLVAPDAPTATVAADGASVTGTGEPGATVTITDAAGQPVASTTVGGDGTYTAPLPSGEADGGSLTVTQTDPAGNTSSPTTVATPDLVAPDAPTATVAADGATVTGTGEPGATVTITDAAGTALGTAIVAADGNYTATLSTPQANGETLDIHQADPSGNVSPNVEVTAPDITVPTGLTAAINGIGTIVTGTGEAGDMVTVRDSSGAVLGTATVANDGGYAIVLTSPQANGQTLDVTQVDPANNASAPVQLVAPDITAPLAPAGTVSADGMSVTGSGEAGATVTIRDSSGTVIGTAMVAADGTYTATLATPQVNGEALHLTQADAANNVSPTTDVAAPDSTAPAGLTAAIDAAGTVVSGVGEPGAIVTIHDPSGTTIGTATVAGDGSYSAIVSTVQGNGEILQVTQTDATGNTSPPVAVTAPDFTAPIAPTASVSADGLDVTGTGEPGATVTIHDPAGAAIGTAVVAADGSYTVTLTTPQTNGQLLSAGQADAAGNPSPTVSATAPDITAPLAPAAAINADGTIVSGTGEAGATVTISDPSGAVIGTTVVAGNGTYAVSLTTPQANGETIHVIQTDTAGNPSLPTSALAPDITAPAAPALTISPDGTIATGTGEPGASVSITNAAGTVIGTGTVAPDGTYSVPLTAAQANGQTVHATEADAAGNVSAQVTTTAPDTTPPAQPVASIDATGTSVSGSGEPGATVTVRDSTNAVIGTGTVDAQGHYSVVLTTPQIDSQVLNVTQADAANNPSIAASVTAPDLTAPLAPVGAIASDGTSITGTGEAGATVTIHDPVGALIGTTTVAGDGTFTMAFLPALTNGQVLELTQTDHAGNVSPPATATAPDLVPNDSPDAPTATVALDGGSVTGTGQTGATVNVTGPGGVVIATATVDGNGNYTATLLPPEVNGETLHITQTDSDGDVSPPATAVAPDLTAPDAPTAAIDTAGLIVNGTGEAGATVHVADATGTEIGTATVNANGNYSVVLTTAQVDGEALTVTQADGAGHISPPTPVTAPDYTPPVAPTITVSADGATVTGIGEPGAQVTITNAAGTVIGTATVAGDGSYTATLGSPQVNGEHLTATEADTAGNVSPPATATAPDTTAPLAPTATVDPSGAIVTGTGEPGATVTVHDSMGNAIGTATVAADGNYAATLSTPELNGQLLHVTQTDAAGNASPATDITAPDITAPAAPTATVSGDGTIVTGLGEAGATVHITDPAGAIIGTATVASDGTYHATLTTPQANGETLDVTQSDPAGNPSPATTATAPDITAPDAPTAVEINQEGTIVTGHGEQGATAEVHDANGTLIGTAIVAADGGFAITLTNPETDGENLSVSQHDPAGNQSSAVPLVAPTDISAFDNHADASIDLVPTTTNENVGNASYLLLLSLNALNLDVQVLGTPNVEFTVQPGHSLDTTFTYNAAATVGVLSDYSVVIQRFDGTNWVAVDGSGNASILELTLLNGNLVSTETLEPGEYRAFVTFDGAAGLGVLGGLSVTGVDNDYIHNISEIPGTATGNVITDAGPGGAIDIVSPQTHIDSVTIGGTTTAVTADHTVIDGAWGTLIINLDGSYAYTPDADPAAIGKTDTFTYTLLDGSDGATGNATLTITIGSPDVSGPPIAANDAAVAAATFDHVVTNVPTAVDASFNTPGAILFPQTGSVSHSFTVDANSTADVTLSAARSGGLALLPTYTITVTDEHGAVVDTLTQTAIAGLPIGTGISLTLDDLPAGTYNYTVSSANVAGTGYDTNVLISETVTHLDQYTLAGTTQIDGNLLDNDAPGSAFAMIQVQSGGHFVDIGDTPVSIAGAYGTLTIDATGDYSYHPSTSLTYSPNDPVDSFIYQIVQPNGQIASAQLDITIDINNGVSPSGAAIVPLNSFEGTHNLAEAVPLAMLTGEPASATPPEHDAAQRSSFALSENGNDVTELLGRYLNDQHSPIAADSPTQAPSDHLTVDLAPPPAPEDPLNYLALPNDGEHERLALLHAA